MKKIILVGYMGSGKSLIGKLLSEKTEYFFSDLDKIIEERTHLTIKKLFETKGELYFRKLENEIFTALLESNQDTIISTGGGTPCYFDNYKMLNNKDNISIYLNASIDTLYNRLIDQKARRPLLTNQSDEEFKTFIAKHLFDRSFFYNQAKHRIDVNDKSPEEIANEIIPLLT